MKSRTYMIISIILLTITIGFIYSSAKASSNEPGTIQDPLVTKSYVDEKIAGILETTRTGNSVISDVYASEETFGLFEVIEVLAGQQLIGEGSTEIILRAGSATAVANEAGDGISDVTSGTDLIMGESIPKNHLLIIPRTDGRGIQITIKSWVMIKGEYTINDK